ncbi:hypothetical protein [Photobacterium marinum]|uniref:hypothetical protein n=1 Tax=Photobacterium marinum TaxID=1056511 RepID=UPI0005629919|nr:hypothetical protein [Photobacterium marinum]
MMEFLEDSGGQMTLKIQGQMHGVVLANLWFKKQTANGMTRVSLLQKQRFYAELVMIELN